MTTSFTAVDTTTRADTTLGRAVPVAVHERYRRRYPGANGVVA